MYIEWTGHSGERFMERSALLGINYGDLEREIIRQKIRIVMGKHKYKTIFEIRGKYFTVIKIEKEKNIKVITLWESNHREELIWKNL